jgi:hypothetical protein
MDVIRCVGCGGAIERGETFVAENGEFFHRRHADDCWEVHIRESKAADEENAARIAAENARNHSPKKAEQREFSYGAF